jgi:D-alanine-D-alanine ligase
MGMNARMKRVAVLMGGTSVERDVSLTSGKGVTDALRSKGYDVTAIDVTDDVTALVRALDPKPDAVFNALHGRAGEDGAIQGLLDLLQIPYTHSGVLASALAMDKPFAKRLFESAGLRCPPGTVARRDAVLAGDVMPRPYVIKPPAEGSSFGVHLVRAGDNKMPFENDPWPYGDEVLVERFIPGRELTVAVRGEADHARAMGAIEIRYGTSFFDYKAKYSDGQAEHLMPPPIHRTAYDELLAMAENAHRTLGCRGISRADFRYDDSDGEPGKLYLLEVNTQPGMTPISLVPDIARSIGITYADLVAGMVEEARWG